MESNSIVAGLFVKIDGDLDGNGVLMLGHFFKTIPKKSLAALLHKNFSSSNLFLMRKLIKSPTSSGQLESDMRPSHMNLIRALELLENRNSIVNRNEERINDMLQVYIKGYNGIVFKEVIKARKYFYSAISSLDRMLKFYNIRECECIDIYEKIYFDN